MTELISIPSRADGFSFGAYSTAPTTQPIGGVVVLQEIFGITEHIKAMCDTFASAGYHAIAPALYDRVERGFHVGHDADGIQQGIAAAMKTPWPQVVADIQAVIDRLPKPVYVTGFCYGGAATWVAAAECEGVSAVSCFYGRLIANLLDRKPKAPVMLHYGARDASIPPDNIESVRAASPASPIYLYDAGHGFCREGSSDFNAGARDLAMTRTLDWFARWR